MDPVVSELLLPVVLQVPWRNVTWDQHISLSPLQSTFWVVHSGLKVLASKEPWFYIPVLFQGLQHLKSWLFIFLPDITSFVFIFLILSFYFTWPWSFQLVRKGLSSWSTEYYATVSCICCIHGICLRHRKKYLLFQMSSSKLNSQPVSFALHSCYAPKCLRDLVSWTQSVSWKHCQKLPNNSSLSLSEQENCVPELSMLNCLITGKEILTFFSIRVYFH